MATYIEFGGGPDVDVRSEATKFKYGTQLVGYTGYIPGMKYTSGKSFPTLSHVLAKHTHDHKHPTIGYKESDSVSRFLPQVVAEEIKQLNKELSKRCKERKFLTDLPPGYAGAIPRYLYESVGLRFGRGSIAAMAEFVKMMQDRNSKSDNMKSYQDCTPCLVPVVCEDQVTDNLRNVVDKHHPCGYPSRRHPLESPITGYMGHIPRSKILLETSGMNHLRESCYGLVTFDCLKKYQDTKLKSACVDPYTEIQPNLCLEKPRIQRIYMQDGMLPRYKGVVPENAFVFGKTYGDSTRSVECCSHREANFGAHQKTKFKVQPIEAVQVIT